MKEKRESNWLGMWDHQRYFSSQVIWCRKDIPQGVRALRVVMYRNTKDVSDENGRPTFVFKIVPANTVQPYDDGWED